MNTASPTPSWPLRFLRILIPSGVFLVFFAFSSRSFYGFITPKYFFLILTASCALPLLAILWKNRALHLGALPRRGILLVALLIAWLAIASLVNHTFAESFWGTFNRATGLGTWTGAWIIMCAVCVASHRTLLTHTLMALAIAGLFSVVWGHLGPTLNLYRPGFNQELASGVFGNSTFAGSALLFSFFSAVALAFLAKKKFQPLWFLTALGILLPPTLLRFTRVPGEAEHAIPLLGDARAASASVALGIAVALVVYIATREKRGIFRTLARATATIATMALILASVFLLHGKSFGFFERAPGFVSRYAHWHIARVALKDKPLIGHGHERFLLLQQKYFDPAGFSSEANGWVDKPHNHLLELGSAGGLPALTLYLALVGLTLFSLARFLSRAPPGADRRAAAVLFGLMVAYHAQTFFSFETLPSMLAHVVVIALALSFTAREKIPQNMEHSPRKGLLPNLVVAGSALVAIFSIYHLAVLPAREGRAIPVMARQNIQERMKMFRPTLAISPVGAGYDESRILGEHHATYFSVYPTLNKETQAAGLRELLELYRFAKERAEARPKDYFAQVIAGRYATLIHMIAPQQALSKEARFYGARALAISPKSPFPYWIIAQSHVLDKRFDRSLLFAVLAIDMNPTLPMAYDAAIEIAKIANDDALVRALTRRAVHTLPGYTFPSR